MKKATIQTIIFVGFLPLLVTSSLANDPASIPWPVGSTEAIMESTKTLMNSYGDPQNDWSLGKFHCGIDLDALTEPPLGTTLVRCVHGAKEPAPVNVIITYIQEPDFTNGSLQYVVVTTEGTGEMTTPTAPRDGVSESQSKEKPRIQKPTVRPEGRGIRPSSDSTMKTMAGVMNT